MRARERGSMMSFIVVGVVLSALLIGGIYYIKNQNNTEVAVVNDTGKNENSSDTAGNSSDTDTASNSSSDNTENMTSDSNESDTTSSSDATSATNDDAASSETDTADDTTTTTLPATGVTADELPRTGASPLMVVLPLGILTAVFVAYRRSARAKA